MKATDVNLIGSSYIRIYRNDTIRIIGLICQTLMGRYLLCEGEGNRLTIGWTSYEDLLGSSIPYSRQKRKVNSRITYTIQLVPIIIPRYDKKGLSGSVSM